MLNPALDRLTDYPFDRLRALLAEIDPPAGMTPRILGLGEPRHPPPPQVTEILAKTSALWGKYPMVNGTAEFRLAVADWLTRRYGLAEGFIDPERQVLPVAGTREALFFAATLSVPERKNGERPTVLLPNPFYHVYAGAALMADAEPVFVPATEETGFLPCFEALPEEVLSRAALAFLCTPANPQGSVADLDALKSMIALARTHDFMLAVDECYAEIYCDAPPPGALLACAEMGGRADHVMVFHSLSKRSSVPGLRSGFVAGDPDTIARFRLLRSYGAAAVPEPILAVSAALWRDEAHVEANRELYRRKFDLADAKLSGRPGYRRPQGGFFLWLDVGDGEEAARRLWSEAAVRVLPGAYLGRPGEDGRNPGAPYIRIALVDDLEATADALERIVQVL